jgi:hypothetical protein
MRKEQSNMKSEMRDRFNRVDKKLEFLEECINIAAKESSDVEKLLRKHMEQPVH